MKYGRYLLIEEEKKRKGKKKKKKKKKPARMVGLQWKYDAQS